MSKGVKAWLIVGAALILMGCILLGGAMMAIQFNFKDLSTVQYQTAQHEITEAYKNISIVTDTGDVVFLPSADGKTSVTCYERKSEVHAVSVQSGTLTVGYSDQRKWYEHIGIFFGTPKITVYLPAEEYGVLSIKTDTGDIKIPRDFRFERMELSGSTGDVENGASVAGELKIKRSTGDITVENVSARSLSLATSTGSITATGVTCAEDAVITVSTGKASLTDLTCKSLSTAGSTGNLAMKNVMADKTLSASRTTGDVKLERCNAGVLSVTTDTGNVKLELCDAGELSVTTDTGDVKGSLLSEKVFIVRSDTGRIDVPKTTSGGKCEIETSTGDIKFDIKI